MSIRLWYRITLTLLMQDQQIIPVNVGEHDAVLLSQAYQPDLLIN